MSRAAAPKTVYTIDFLGATFQSSAVQDPPPPAPEVKKAEPAAVPSAPAVPDKNIYAGKTEIAAKPKPKPKPAPKKIVLGAPSVLSDKPAAPPAAQTNSAPASAENSVALKTDMPDFPFPWFITQVRNSLWTEWSKRKPQSANRQALINFSIQRDGSVTNVKAAQKSGDDTYDYAAIAAVTNAAPFPALPEGFTKNELTVTVDFKDI